VVAKSSGEPIPQSGQRRQRSGFAVKLAEVGQAGERRSALVRNDPLDVDTAPQRGRQNTARAGADDQVHLTEGGSQLLLQGRQRAGRPGAAEHSARAQHKADARTPSGRSPGPRHGHGCLRTSPPL